MSNDIKNSKYKPILVTELNKCFDSIIECSYELELMFKRKFNTPSIKRACEGCKNNYYNGFHFKYVNCDN